MNITRANHVWCADITYIPMARGFCYLVVIMDWFSRYVLAWRLSNTLDSSFCVDALEEALANYGCPEIFNTDQGRQFTAEVFTETLHSNNIAQENFVPDFVYDPEKWKNPFHEERFTKPVLRPDGS